MADLRPLNSIVRRQGMFAMFFEAMLLLAAAVNPPTTASATSAEPRPIEAVSIESQKVLAMKLAERLTQVCSSHPEVERAFLMGKPGEDGSIVFTFVPIFDRKVSDQALDEAQAAYRELFPGKGGLPMVLLARNTWKKSLGGRTPFYIRPGK